MSVGERRRCGGFESRPSSSRGPFEWSSDGRIWVVSTPSEEPLIRSDPCTAGVSAIARGFESRPSRSTRCGDHNVSPGQGLFLAPPSETTSSRSFKPSRRSAERKQNPASQLATVAGWALSTSPSQTSGPLPRHAPSVRTSSSVPRTEDLLTEVGHDASPRGPRARLTTSWSGGSCTSDSTRSLPLEPAW